MKELLTSVCLILLTTLPAFSADSRLGKPTVIPSTPVTINQPQGDSGCRLGYLPTANAEGLWKSSQEEILRYFDPGCLSQPQSKIQLHVEIMDSLLPKCSLQSAEKSTDTDRFYCEQAVWEAAPLNPAYKGIQGTCSFISEGMQHKALGLAGAKSGTVNLHLIPAGILYRHPGLMSPSYIYGKSNVLTMREAELNNSRLNEFRSDWLNFFVENRQPSKSQIELEAKHLKEKYADLFSD